MWEGLLDTVLKTFFPVCDAKEEVPSGTSSFPYAKASLLNYSLHSFPKARKKAPQMYGEPFYSVAEINLEIQRTATSALRYSGRHHFHWASSDAKSSAASEAGWGSMFSVIPR